ncbi:undecaprenyl-phosphate glucose phosphotransferase [Candidatus Methylocalor cossyra]|uniref:Colanic acid biosynthesis UDP-glucose lipid carrier transferase n=1 Tax=Candidatus Methylocalor cossyra TaxID=3108543 RepID=A0ABM9NJQ9_9GAMM
MRANDEHVAKRPFVKEYLPTVPVILRLLDVVALSGAAWLAYYLWHGNLSLDIQYRTTIILATLIAIIFFEFTEIYRPKRISTAAGQVWLMLQATTATMLVLIVIVKHWIPEFSLDSNFPLLALWWLISFLSVAGSRIVVLFALRRLRHGGSRKGRIAIVGMSDMAVSTVRRIEHSPWAGITVVGYVDDRAAPRLSRELNALRYLGTVKDLPAIVQRENLEQIWVCYPLKDAAKTQEVIDILRHETVGIRLVIDCHSFATGPGTTAFLNNVAGIPTLDISVSPLDGINHYVKELEDRILALIALILLAPLMVCIAIGVKLSSPGPVFYRQERVGWNNRKFIMLKFRSMPVNAEAKTGPVWAKPNEKRATPFGAFLRKTSLDELPQLINVLKGEMSLVGPRPERPAFVEVFKEQIPNYMKKHMVKAGITGWAQVNGWRGDTDLHTRIQYDLYYIQNWSVWFDLVIAVKTLFKGMVNKNAY